MIQRMFVTLDTKKTNYKNVGKINHGDDLILEITVLSDGDMISFNDPMVDLLVKKSDGKMIRQNSGIEHIKPNKFIIEVMKDCVTSPGLTTNQLVINDNGRISTCMFYYTILNSLEEDIIESISNVEVLEQLDEFTIQIKDKMENFDEELQNRMSELEDAIDDLVEFFGDTSVELLEAEISRNEAEQSRTQAESVRVQNESRRLQNDLDLANAEAERVRAENIRIQNEADRALVDAVMDQKESKREDSELERIQNESKRATDELVRQQNESTRQSNESIRMSNEIDRKTQENRRATAETNRVNAETTRRNNENSRISNETERQKTIKEMKSLLEDAREFDERVGVIEDEIEEINSSLDNIENTKQEVINIKKMFGAKGDNKTDDTQAFINAIEYCKENDVKIIYIPCGKYLLNDTLNIDFSGLTFVGDGNDINGDGGTLIYRNVDKTIFNVCGNATLEKYSNIENVVFKNIAFRDKSNLYQTTFMNLHYIQWFLIEYCTFYINNSVMDLRQVYDSRILNCDIAGGGNETLDIPAICIRGGKHASLTEIGWDSANAINIIGCRFERFKGTAIKTTAETQPETINPNVNPCVARNSNNIRISNTRIQSHYVVNKPLLEFNETNTISLDTNISCVDGQDTLETVVKFNNCKGITGIANVSYFDIDGITQTDFNKPVMKFLGCGYVDLVVRPNISSKYKLSYLFELDKNNSGYRTITIRCPYSYANKKLYNDSSNPLNVGIQGRQMFYGENGYNGLAFRYDETLTDEYYINTQNVNGKNYLRHGYKLNNNSVKFVEDIISDSVGSYKNMNVPTIIKDGIYIGNATPLNTLSGTNSSREQRLIKFATEYPTTAETDVVYKQGDIIFNSRPTVGGFIGWVCVSSGNPGIWKTFGVISS